MSRTAVIAFSFGKRAVDAEPNPVNQRLATAAVRAVHERSAALLLAQWEVARGVVKSEKLVALGSPDDGYQSSEDIWAEAVPILQAMGVDEVVPIAQPFLQMRKIRKMIIRSGFPLTSTKVGWVGFDSSAMNEQNWTRGPIRLTVYALNQLLTTSRRHLAR